MRSKQIKNVDKLAAQIETEAPTSIGNSLAQLLSRRSRLKEVRNIDELIHLCDPETADYDARLLGDVHHLTVVRASIARELWKRGLYAGTSVLDELLFYVAAHTNRKNLIKALLEELRDCGINSPGTLIIPLHGFGIVGAGLLHSFTNRRVSYEDLDIGVCLFPQTNDYDETWRQLRRSFKVLGVDRKLPVELLEHWVRSRGAKWLKRNPLMVIRNHAIHGSYYENQSLFYARVQATNAALAMANSMAAAVNEARFFDSSASVNNWSTRDVGHYIALYPKPRTEKELTGDCIPLHRSEFAELLELPLDLNLKRLKATARKDAKRLIEAVKFVHSGYIEHSLSDRANSPEARLYRKLFGTFEYFQRSLRRGEDWSTTVSLAIAFEMLLLDHYAKGVKARILRRVSLLLKRRRGKKHLVDVVDDLYQARGAIVHSGSATVQADFQQGQRVFSLCFAKLVERLSGVGSIDPSNPVGVLCED